MIKVDENILYGGHVMTNERNRKHKKRKKEAEMNFFCNKGNIRGRNSCIDYYSKGYFRVMCPNPGMGGDALFEHLFYCIYCRSMHNNC